MNQHARQQFHDLIQRLDALPQAGDPEHQAVLAELRAVLARLEEEAASSAAGSAPEPEASPSPGYQPDYCRTDLSGVLVEVSAGLAAFLGTEPDHLIGRSILDLLKPDRCAEIRKCLDQMENSGSLQIWELDLQVNEQHTARFVAVVRPFDGERGSRLAHWQMFGLTRDEADTTAYKLHSLHSSLLDDLPGLAYRCLNNPDYTMIYISQGCRELTGYAPEELLGNQSLTFADLIVEEDRERVWRKIQATAENDQYQLTYRIRTATGDQKWVWEQGRVTAETYNGIPVLEGFITDVSVQFETENALLQRTEEMSLLYEASTQLSQSLDPDTLYETLHTVISRRMDCDGLFISDYSPETGQITCAYAWGKAGRLDVNQFPPIPLNDEGLGIQSVVIRTGTSLNLPDVVAQARTSRTCFVVDDASQLTTFSTDDNPGEGAPRSALIVPLKREGQVIGVLQVFSDRPHAYTDNELHFVEALGPMYEVVAANVALYQRAQQEISERTAAEEAIRFQALLLDSISQAVIATDLESRVIYWNSFASTMYGWSEAEALGSNFGALIIPAEDQAKASMILEQVLSGASWVGELTVQHKDGTRFPAMVSGTPIQDDTGRLIGVLGISWDISERKFTEEILENQARQMALINQVGGQINGMLDLDRALNHAARLVQSTFDYQHVGLFILDETSQRLTMRARDGIYASRFPANHALALGEGIVGWVAEHGRRLLANDVRQEQRYRNPFSDETIKSELAVPIQTGNEILGVLDIQSQDLEAFDQTDVLVLETLADQLAIAIQNARLYEAERQQRELAEALSELAAILSSTLEPDEILDRILSHVGAVIPHDAANIFVMEDGQGRYVCWQGYTAEIENYMRSHSGPLAGDPLTQAMIQGEIILVSETQGATIWPPNPGLSWIRSHLGVPIRYKGGFFGYLSLDSSIPNHFTPRDASRLQAIADQAAMAIQNARLYQAEREQRHMAEALREMAAIMSGTLELEEIIPHVLPYAERIIPHDFSTILMFEEGKAQFVAWHGHLMPDQMSLDRLQLEVDDYPLFQRMVHGEAILIPYTADAPDWPNSRRLVRMHSYLGVPIRSQGVVLGFLNLASETPYRFAQADVDRLQAVADQVAVAIRNARLYQAEREQRRMAEALRDLAAVLSSTLDPDEVLKRILEQIGRVIKHDASILLLIEDQEAHITAWRGFPPNAEDYLRSRRFSLELSDFHHMLTTGTPVIIRDTATYPDWVGGPEIAWIRSQLSVPIRYQETVIGFLNLDNAQPDSFTTSDAENLQAIADQAAMAIQNARLYQAEREQHRLTEALRDMAASISGTLSIDKLLQRLLENVGRVVPHDRGNIMLISGNTIEVAHVHGYGEYTEKALKVRFSLGTPNLQRMMETGEPCVIPDTRDYAGWKQIVETHDVRSYIGVPIQARSAVIGFLNLDSYTPNFFTQEHAEILMTFVHQASVAIQNARLYQDLETYSESLELAVKERTVELNRSRERVEAILNGSSDAIVFLDDQGTIRQANPAFNALFGYEVDETFGHPLTDLAPSDQWPLLIEALQTSSESALPERIEITACRKDGTPFDADVALSPVRSGPILLGLVCSLRDITARKASEKALKDALDKERDLGQLKSRFVSMASHEFRTPLTTILSSTFLLENRLDRMNEDQKSRHFQKIKGSVEHMNQLLEDVLTIGTAEAGRLEFNPEIVNIGDLCREAVEEAQLGTETRVHLNFTAVSDNCQVVMDSKLVRQILDNLLSNAIKYSPQGGAVHVDVQCKEHSTTIRVQDTGIGIPESDQKHLFDPFHRGGNVAGIQGTGLGLAITKRSVDLHQGSLTFESHEGVGTTFTVVLPNTPPALDSSPDD